MKSVRRGIVSGVLFAAMFFSSGGCRYSIQDRVNPLSTAAESLYLEEMFEPRQALLSDHERVEVLKLLSEAKPHIHQWDGSPSPLLKYQLVVPLSGDDKVFFFWYDGTLIDAVLPEEKVRALAGIIVGVAKRMEKVHRDK